MEADANPKEIEISCHADDRGFLYQFYKGYNFPEVKRIYLVGNNSKNIIRGFHKHLREWKAYFVARGTVKFVLVDEQKAITNYILSDRKPSVLVVPPKYSHGWVSLTEETLVIGLSNETLEGSMEDDFREDPFLYGKEVWETKAR
ncbi:MAG: dTDP-4-dehydrorhamnose 3,5-epimerase family protein [Candidatus Bathyarchaeia archaeon]|jgi:dTDP-4-dehydrorhamnose 3,5-epimerase-like enzyme